MFMVFTMFTMFTVFTVKTTIPYIRDVYMARDKSIYSLAYARKNSVNTVNTVNKV